MSAVVERPNRLPPARPAGNGSPRRICLLTLISVLVGLIGAGWIWQNRHSSAMRGGRHGTRSMLIRGDRGRSEDAMRLYVNSYIGAINPRPVPQRLPRYVANFAAQVGDYTLSVRQIIRPSYQRTLYETLPLNSPRRPVGRISISLQVMTPDEAALKRIKAFAPALKVTDSTGHALTTLGADGIVAFAKGFARIVRMTEPDPNANYLKSVEGELILKGRKEGENETHIPFHLVNIPLPVTNHIFGVASATILSGSRLSLASLPSKQEERPFQVLTGRQVDALRSQFPPYAAEPNPLNVPDRLILQPDLPGEFSLTLPNHDPTRRIRCRLLIQRASGGELQTDIEFARGGAPFSGLPTRLGLWDNEPVILLFPAAQFGVKSSPGQKVALLLQLQTEINSDETPLEVNCVTPFLAKKGERGGELTGDVCVGEEAVRRGNVVLEVMRLDEQGRPISEPVAMTLPLSRRGVWRLSNVSPGRYRLHILSAEAYRSAMTPPFQWNEYLQARYGITTPEWTVATQEVALRAGGTTCLKSWSAVQGKTL